MTCGHCVSTITKAVRTVDRAANVQVDLAAHRMQIEPTESNAQELSDVIAEAGYTPVPVQAATVAPKPAKSGGCCGCCT
jgi:copper chaperone